MRRFIAGATCPRCRALDRIVVEEHNGVRRRRCVSCGHADTFETGATTPPDTRFARPAGEGADSEGNAGQRASPVRIIDPVKVDPGIIDPAIIKPGKGDR
jgi:uncharacterized protein